MTEATVEGAAPLVGSEAPLAQGTPPAAAPSGSEAGAKPAWLVEDKFWDGEAKAVRVEDMHKSYRELQSAFGKRINELPPAARKTLFEAVPDDVRTAWAKEERDRLADDPEFLTPLQEKWLAEKLPKAPEKYEPPADLPIDTEHPAFAELAVVAKEAGLSQDAFNKLAKMGLDLVAPYEANPTLETLTAAIGPDLAPRAMAVGNRMRTLLGEEQGNALLRTMRTPEHFLALERLVHAGGERPIPMGEAAPTAPAWTAQTLLQATMDDRYLPGPKHDPAFHASVTAGFRKVYPSDRV